MQKAVFYLFCILFFLIPIALWPFTSEVFEFNKIVLVYMLATLISGVWISKSIIQGKIIFRRTILDVPILIFIASQLISTIFSIDPSTSWFGYYSRFNGGLASVIAYSVLYWAYVSNIDLRETKKIIKVFLSSAALVSTYAVLEHFGIDKNLWVQDVQSRVFSTLGQPNWLAAWLTALLPITWVLILTSKKNKFAYWAYNLLSILFFWVLIFTKSRSGILGFLVASAIFWGYYFWSNRKDLKKEILSSIVLFLPIILVIIISGTPWTPSFYSLVSGSKQKVVNPTGPALETGGTESGTIRKIVWKGAIEVWKHYPIFGTGPETFAYSYYMYRPVEHNLVSEWDFIYNKAHNDFLNYAANSGTFGLLSYLGLIAATVYLFVKNPKSETNIWNWAFLSGYLSLSATNFFGFSVVPTQIEFFLFPAFAVSLASSTSPIFKQSKTNDSQKLFILATAVVASIILFNTGKYWWADTLFAKGKAYNASGKSEVAIKYLMDAIKLEPKQPIYRSEYANALTSEALSLSQAKDTQNSGKVIHAALSESQKSISLSPANPNLKRARFGIFIMLSTIDPKYLLEAQKTLLETIAQAPTDAKLYYNLGLTYARTGQPDKAAEVLRKTIELKSNYKEARLAYAILLISKGDKAGARAQLEYILGNIDPNDSLTKQTLESVK